MTPRKIANAVLVGLFLASISAYGVASLWSAVADRVGFARGALMSWRQLPVWFDEYFNNHLAGRETIVAAHGRIKAEWLGASPNPKVWIGRDGWLFFNQTAEAGFVSPHDPDFPARLDSWAASLSARRAWLSARGMHFLVVAAPDKQSIYPEQLPRLARRRGPAPMDELLERCGHDPELCLVDLRAPLRAARPAGRLFWLTDTHWSPIGDYAGYSATIGALSRWYPNLSPLPWSSFGTGSTRLPAGDLARLMGIERRRTEDLPRLDWHVRSHSRPVSEGITYQKDPKMGHVPAVVWVNETPGLPRVVLLGDSFADDKYCKLLAEHCSRLVRVGSYQPQEELIEREHPDVVICEFVERMLEGFVPRLH